MGNPFASVAAWSARHPWFAVVISLIAIVGTGSGLTQAEQGRIGELFVPDDLPALDTQRHIEAIWGETEGSFLLYLTDDPTNPALIRAVARDAENALAIDGALDTAGIHTLLEARLGDLDKASDQEIQAAAKNFLSTPAGQPFMAADALLMRITLEPVDDIPTMIQSLDAVRDASTANADIRSASGLHVEEEQNQNAGGDVAFLMPLSLGVIILLLSVLFRRFQDVAIPMTTVLMSILMAYGTVAWAGMELAPPSFIVMPLLLGLGVDYMLHIVYAYREEPTTKSLPRRFRGVGHHVGYPVFFTAATTLIGFGSFLASNIPQIRTWGLLIGSGALYSFLLGFLLLPALYRMRRQKQRTIKLPLGGLMDRIADGIMGNRALVLVLALLATTGLATAAAFVDVEDSLDFEPDLSSPAMIDLTAVQDRFGGQSLVMFLVPAADRAELETFEANLEASPWSGFVDGPIHRLARTANPNGPLVGSATEGVATEEYWLIQVGFKFEEREDAVDHFEAIAAESPLDARLTGAEVLDRESRASFLDSLFISTLTALVLVVLLLAAIFRQPLMAGLAFLPLAVTIVWQLGLQTITGIPINPITGVMTAMILGVGVDYSLHIMAHFQESRQNGATSRAAADTALRSVGRPILAASMTTVFAFSVLGFSSLVPLRQFGIVAAIVVTCAWIVSTTLLPVLASYLPNPKAAKTRTHAATSNTAPALAPTPTQSLGSALYPHIRPRFQDPDVEAWYQETKRGTTARRLALDD